MHIDHTQTYELVGHITVVLAGHALANSRLHETRERGEHVDRRRNLAVVQLAVDVDLALRNVPRQVGNRVRDI